MTTRLRGSDNFDTEVGQKGAAKAWVNFNGTGTVAIRDSYNVSSITDNGTGKYTVNFETAMPDANYSFTATAGLNGGANTLAAQTESPTVNGVTFNVRTTSNTVFDADYCNATIHGN
jgi:hypothetical protein